MIKRKIVLFLSIFSMLLFSTSAAASSNESLKNDDIDLDFQKKCISTYESGNLYRKLYYSFSEDEDGTKIYPDTYAGAWVEGKNYLLLLQIIVIKRLAFIMKYWKKQKMLITY